jgi:hypothetical protein
MLEIKRKLVALNNFFSTCCLQHPKHAKLQSVNLWKSRLHECKGARERDRKHEYVPRGSDSSRYLMSLLEKSRTQSPKDIVLGHKDQPIFP